MNENTNQLDDTQSLCGMACSILSKTRDGEDLAPEHLYLLQCAVNGELNEKGVEFFTQICNDVEAGNYSKPWLYGVENLTQDHEGYVYWRDKHVEHYSFDNVDEGKRAAEELAERCRHLESIDVEVSNRNAIWRWEHYEQKKEIQIA